MPTCDYCGERSDDEATHLDHLAEAHEDELSRIDRRRVEQFHSDGGGVPLGLVAGVVVALALVVGVGYALYGGGGGDAGTASAATTPHDVWSVHYHGTIEMVVDGEPVDFGRDRYQVQADAFHFEGGDGDRWHGHARDITIAWAMATLDIEVTADSVTVRGTSYRDGENARVSITVNDNPVDPEKYVLRDGDHVRIVVETT